MGPEILGRYQSLYEGAKIAVWTTKFLEGHSTRIEVHTLEGPKIMKMSCNQNFSSGPKTFWSGTKFQFGPQNFLEGPKIEVQHVGGAQNYENVTQSKF